MLTLQRRTKANKAIKSRVRRLTRKPSSPPQRGKVNGIPITAKNWDFPNAESIKRRTPAPTLLDSKVYTYIPGLREFRASTKPLTLVQDRESRRLTNDIGSSEIIGSLYQLRVLRAIIRYLEEFTSFCKFLTTYCRGQRHRLKHLRSLAYMVPLRLSFVKIGEVSGPKLFPAWVRNSYEAAMSALTRRDTTISQ